MSTLILEEINMKKRDIFKELNIEKEYGSGSGSGSGSGYDNGILVVPLDENKKNDWKKAVYFPQ